MARLRLKLLLLSALLTRPTQSTTTTTLRHTSTITIVQTIHASAATATASATTDEHSYTDDGVFKSTVLNISNTVRQNYNASALLWNNTLADYAQAWSEGCRFEHSNGPYGENLAATYPSAADAVTAWANESQHFTFADPGFSEGTGHFSQMVWKGTAAMGCGRTNCGSVDEGGDGDDADADGWYVVCSYWPRGNVLGQFAANVDAAVDGSGSSWDEEGMIAKSKSGVARADVRRGLLGVQLLALASWAALA
ncbi:extracellular scp domain protein [Diplodia corticola]|uniref:Extracellular scp domain protein n=1 Tax=Diplodia corticola TaxID=236234 RepID=A0A1J9RY01_9PEZI|nr:extracellular scp domain protein [Diplodia corticola]OJD32700.1 extracellular scp domain protein [Diplodia corticola]